MRKALGDAYQARELHGMRYTRTYQSWCNMKSRCNNPSNSAYKWYGGRGITYDPSWDEYAPFLADMGECPLDLSLDRINVNGNYEPANCRWATAREQANNKRTKSKSGYAGAYLEKRTGRFNSRANIDGKKIHLGTFNTAIEAHQAYLKATGSDSWGKANPA